MNNLIIKQSLYKVWSGGEVRAFLRSLPSDHLHVTCLDYSMNGFMALAQTVEIARRKRCKGISLTYPYLPYARQDRVTSEEESFSMKVFARMINALDFESVTVYDPHSDVGPALIDRCHIVHQSVLWSKMVPDSVLRDPNTLFVAPDAGAAKKLININPEQLVLAYKKRNSSGAPIISGIHSPVDMKGRSCLIIDDICDGGRTFTELAAALREHHVSSVGLYVTHGIFSHGTDSLSPLINHIWTTDSFDSPIGINTTRSNVFLPES